MGLTFGLIFIVSGPRFISCWQASLLFPRVPSCRRSAGADGLIVGTGAPNTADIILECSEAGIAARIADSFSLGGFNDWFLPSKDELNELFLQKAVVGGFTSGTYWSSSEVSRFLAWVQGFGSGSQDGLDKDATLRVRAVRAF